MKQLLIAAMLVATVVGRPEMYKEKEDFQYSRSSTDEGSKSGYYGAQRGNMGGNYEKAHNMDNLAQGQMSNIMKQVHGEVGESTSNTRAGNLFGSASTRGTYGQGYYDLANLSGRNFADSSSNGNLQSHSSLTSHNFGYKGAHESESHAGNSEYYSDRSSATSQNSRYRGHGSNSQSNVNLNQELQTLSSDADHYRSNARHGSSYQSGYGTQGSYDQFNNNDMQSQTDNFGSNNARTMRIRIRPGTKMDVPFTATNLEENQRSAKVDHNGLNVNRNTEWLEAGDDTSRNMGTKSHGKQYESSYSYRKEWEKHKSSVNPLSIHTSDDTQDDWSNSFHNRQLNSEQAIGSRLYDRSNQQLQRAGSESQTHNRFRNEYSNAKFSTLHGQNQYNEDQRSLSSANLQSNANNLLYNNNEGSLVDNQRTVTGAPKRYESSYSYHKSWERHGDPYMIKPASSGQGAETSQQLRDYSSYSGQNTKSHSHNHGSDDDCDGDNAHTRHRRSYNSFYHHDNEQELENEHFTNNQQQEVPWASNKYTENQKNEDQMSQQFNDNWQQLNAFYQDYKNIMNEGKELHGGYPYTFEHPTSNTRNKGYLSADNDKEPYISTGYFNENKYNSQNMDQHSRNANEEQDQINLDNFNDYNHHKFDQFDNENQEQMENHFHTEHGSFGEQNINHYAIFDQQDINNHNIFGDQSEQSSIFRQNNEQEQQQISRETIDHDGQLPQNSIGQKQQTSQNNIEQETQLLQNSDDVFTHTWQSETGFDNTRTINDKLDVQETENLDHTSDHYSTLQHFWDKLDQLEKGLTNSEKNTNNQESTTEKLFVEQGNENTNSDFLRPSDLGRGDIQPEIIKDYTESTNVPIGQHQEKSPQEIEILSLTKDDMKYPTGKVSTEEPDLSVRGLGKTETDKNYLQGYSEQPQTELDHFEQTNENLWAQSQNIEGDNLRILPNDQHVQGLEHFGDDQQEQSNLAQANEHLEDFGHPLNKVHDIDQSQIEHSDFYTNQKDDKSKHNELVNNEMQQNTLGLENRDQQSQLNVLHSSDEAQVDNLNQVQNNLQESESIFTPDQQQNSESFDNFYKQKYLEADAINRESVDLTKNHEVDHEIPVEVVSENPGFWKKIGNKFSNAKNQVASWFSKSK